MNHWMKFFQKNVGDDSKVSTTAPSNWIARVKKADDTLINPF